MLNDVKLRKKSFTYRIWMAILICSALMIVSVYIILRVFYRQELLDNMELQYGYEDSIHHESIQNYSETANSCVNTIILHLNDTLEEEDLLDGYPKILTATQKKIYRCMLNTFRMFPDPVEVLVVWNNGVQFYQGKGYSMKYGGSALLNEMKEIQVTRKGKWITSLNAGAAMNGDGLYYVKPYSDIDTGRQLGYIVLNLGTIGSLQSSVESNRTYYLFGEDGLLLQTTNEKAREEVWNYPDYWSRCAVSEELYSRLYARKEGRETLMNAEKLDCGWEMISVADMNSVLLSLENTVNVILAVCIAVLLLMFGIVGLVISRTIRPIRLLSNHMLGNRGELPEVFSLKHSNDEIGVLIDRYNQMIHNNRELFEQILRSEKQQKQLEFSLLQAQIKPHFLYNSLDVIYCLNAVGRYDEASAMTKLLSEYYRRSLSAGMECIPLSQEVEMTRIYLEIQMLRYRNILSYSIECVDGIPNLSIPKLTLQPLVENAIYHGIKPMGKPGQVKIVIAQRGDGQEIRVIDDGQGFSQEKFAHVLSENATAGESFGLRNVAERLRLYYGDRCSFDLEASECGTSILIRIQ